MGKRRELQVEIRDEDSLRKALIWAEARIRVGLRGGAVLLSLTRPRRTLDQNAKLWPMLRDISRQVIWRGRRLSEDQWKDVFTANLLRQDWIEGLDDEPVFFGASTSRLPKKLFRELIELVFVFGNEHEVQWSAESERRLRKLRRDPP